MMRLCPKCGDYYADAALAFCLEDGTPLVGVSPHSESWGEGVRVIEEKENALRKRERRLKWRRVLSVLTTMLMVTTVLIVVAVNGFIYLKPQREEVAPPATPTPTPVYKIGGRVTDGGMALGGVHLILGGAQTASTTTDANGAYTFGNLPAGGSYTITPAGAKMDFTPPRRSINRLTRDQSADFVGAVQAECSGDDEIRERGIVINSCGGDWRRAIEADRSKILAESGVAGLENVSASLSEKIEYQIAFSKACRAGVVTARYTWQVTAPTIRTRPLPQEKKFTLVKTGERWRCG